MCGWHGPTVSFLSNNLGTSLRLGGTTIKEPASSFAVHCCVGNHRGVSRRRWREITSAFVQTPPQSPHSTPSRLDRISPAVHVLA